MERMPRAILCIALLLWAACAVTATPSFRGYSGLVKIPNAQTLDRGEFSFGTMSEDTASIEPTDAFATYSPRDDVELGINSFLPTGTETRKAVFNAKYRFLQEAEKLPSIACGLIDFTNQVDATAYVVASKALLRRASIFDSLVTSIRGNVGLGVGELNGVFAGISIYAGNRVMFSAEWDSKDVNLGFRFTPIKGFRLHAAMFDVGNVDHFGVGMSFTKTY